MDFAREDRHGQVGHEKERDDQREPRRFTLLVELHGHDDVRDDVGEVDGDGDDGEGPPSEPHQTGETTARGVSIGLHWRRRRDMHVPAIRLGLNRNAYHLTPTVAKIATSGRLHLSGATVRQRKGVEVTAIRTEGIGCDWYKRRNTVTRAHRT
jgi:hypothetical protein